ncbi:MAG: hypothetical protein ABIW76_07460, partial [Fibrobacteria bacterium]
MKQLRFFLMIFAIASGNPLLAPAGEHSSKSTFSFPNALPGKSIEITKSIDGKTGESKLFSNSEYVATQEDLVKFETIERNLVKKRYGSVSDGLKGKFDNFPKGKRISVLVSLKIPEGITYLDKTKHLENEMIAQSEGLQFISPLVGIQTVLARHGVNTFEKRGLSIGRCDVSKQELDGLAFDESIASIDEYEAPMPSQSGNPNFISLAASAYSHGTTQPPANFGNGVNAATFETGIDIAAMNCFGGLNPSQIDQKTAPWDNWEHSQQTFRCLRYAAPGANAWHRNSLSYETSDDKSYFFQNNIKTTSLSYARGVRFPSNEVNTEFRVMDDFAYR